MKTRRILAFLLCLVMVIAACGCAKTDKAQTAAGERSLTHKITDEPLELTLFAKEIDDYADKSIWLGAADMTNVLLKPTLSENVTDMDQALALAVAAKNIPDVIYDWKQENFNKYGAQGALIPLNDLIEEHAPNYKKFLEDNPDVKYYSTADDGNIYHIPAIADGDASTAWFIRQDWLDKLGLEAPNNLEEFYNVMVAFRDQDPNGNGQKDEVPVFTRLGDVEAFFSLFNTSETFKYQDGKVSYGPLDEAKFLPAIIEITKWYKEGLIDREFFTRSDAKDYFTTNNTGGIIHDWLGSTAKRNDVLQETIPGFNLTVFAPPEGVDGVRREQNRRSRFMGEGWGISSMNEHPVETIKLFDFFYSEEGRRLANFGLEGVHYDMIDGKPQFKDSILHAEESVAAIMSKSRSLINFGYWQDYEYEAQWSNQIAVDGLKMYTEGGYLPDPLEQPYLSYFEDADRHNTLKTQIETHLDETLQQWIFGRKDPATDYANFKETLKTLGVDEYIEIEQKAYTKYLNEVAQ